MSTAWVDCGEPDIATQRTPPHGCKSSSTKVREHPTVGGVADGVEHCLPSHAVVGHVEAAAGVRLAMVHGHDQFRMVSADRRGDRSPQRQSGLQRPVGKVEELERLDADGVAGGALLGGPQRRGLHRVKVVDPGFAAGHQEVADRLAGIRPRGDGRRRAVLHVVGVRHDGQAGRPIGRHLEQVIHGRHHGVSRGGGGGLGDLLGGLLGGGQR